MNRVAVASAEWRWTVTWNLERTDCIWNYYFV